MIFITALCIGIVAFVWLYPDDIILSLGNKAPDSWKVRYRTQLQVLDLNITPEYIAGIRLIGFAAGFLIALLLLTTQGFFISLIGIVIAFGCLIIPDKWLRYRERKRLNELSRDFPVMVTLVRVYSKASDLYKALYIVRDAVEGEMKKQLDILALEMSIYPMDRALDNFAARCRFLPVSNFVAVVRYGMISGSDIDDILGTFSRRTYSDRVNEIKRKIKIKPFIMVVIPAFMMLVITLLLIVPMFTNIITRLQMI